MGSPGFFRGEVAAATGGGLDGQRAPAAHLASDQVQRARQDSDELVAALHADAGSGGQPPQGGRMGQQVRTEGINRINLLCITLPDIIQYRTKTTIQVVDGSRRGNEH